MKSRFPVQIYPEMCRGSVSCRIKQRQCHAEEEGLQEYPSGNQSTLGNRLESTQELINS